MIRYFAEALEPVLIIAGASALLVRFGHWSWDMAVITAFIAYVVCYFLIRSGHKFMVERRKNSN